MSIFPPSATHLNRTYNIAALDLPIPNCLSDRNDEAEWLSYAKCLPIARAIEKFGQALDQFLDLLPDSGKKASKLTLDEKLTVYAKWNAASIINANVIGEKVSFALNPQQDDIAYKSDLGRGAFFVVEFLKSVQSPLATEWENRRLRLHAEYCDRDDKYDMGSPINVILAAEHKHRSAVQSQKPPQTPPAP
ncbi:hypothetical protein [Micavibrio aeruginosavorus]|uniref:hypothetical protein n=1 Tax=Micavibrio aeruginosavorus TaxID=349221 RepID=UPI003F4A8AA4